MKTVSYAITVCNEINEIQNLLLQINVHFQEGDEVVVLFDSDNGTEEVENYLKIVSRLSENPDPHSKIKYIMDFKYFKYPLNNDFASFKNYLKSKCTKDYIFQIDADETLHPILLNNLHLILENNDVDVYLVPRENYVEGITIGDITQWGWIVDDKNRINYPDLQCRILKNIPEIKWQNKVHEVIVGHKTLSILPADVEGYCLIHIKDIERQRKQNKFYQTI